MKKVLVFGLTDVAGGVESVIMNYYRNIDRNKVKFDFLCNTEKVAYEDEIKSLGGKIYRIPARSKKIFDYKKALKKFFKEHSNEYDSIWVNICSLANIDYLKMAKKYKIKTRIIHCHNSQNMDSRLRGLLHKYNKIFLKRYATDFWSCSNSSSPWFYSKNIINSDKYRVINNAIDVQKFVYNEKIRKEYRNKLNLEEDTLVIGNVGRFHFQKNHTFIVDIYEQVFKRIPNSQLLLIGVGEDEEKIKNLVKEKNIQNNVKFLGSRSDVNNLLQAMDIFLFPSVFEGLPVTLIEAQASGLKIFASSDNIPEDVKIDDENFEFISLNKSAEYWSNEIIKGYKQIKDRPNNYNLIKKAGYDIKEEVKKMENFFINN